MKAVVACVLVVLVAPVLQVAVVNGLSLPGGGPDVVLVAVVALAPLLRPGAGAFLGFAAGLAADVAPPADHTIGRLALVMCLAGWVCARITADGSAGRRAAVAAAVALGTTLAGGVLAALLDGTPWGTALAPGAVAWTAGLAAFVAAALALLPRRRSFGRVPRDSSRDRYGRGRRLA
ncbi:rod shape-determining protein MreD [Microbispora sp. SCL1-1]|uniref:Rod shape-determining protein MreD n=1 Tax=Microbispora hainanensis TaxID=568844 RepID=A0ABZ1T1Q1_9ACTN|nr:MULTISPECIES: rod shape-determining protein MreD [Microbispora]NJP24915.1 rod shape-determining protein MreD [Microbispora sp. CL1-1]TQS14368.1 rod shape-determining protein MreD [Microbispora sp. SCL1-1]